MCLVCGILFLSGYGCALWPKPAPPPPPPAKPAARPHGDTKAQQQYYDQGLQQYSKENYGEAREAFEQVIELGSNTPLGLKAQENLKKIQQILKTLEEIKAK